MAHANGDAAQDPARCRSKGITVVGSWRYDAQQPSSFAFFDGDFSGVSQRTFYARVGTSTSAGLADVAYLAGGDRIIVGSFIEDSAYHAWVARVRAP